MSKSTPPNLLALPRPKVRIRSKRAAVVAHWFGIVPKRPSKKTALNNQRATKRVSSAARNKLLRNLLPAPGEILLITGPSGAGKSSTLAALRKLASPTVSWIDLQQMNLPDRPIVDCLEMSSMRDDETLRRVLAALGRVGLAEAWSYLRTPAELSEGQRWRLKLAIALNHATVRAVVESSEDSESSKRPILVADEFAALLDRVTACVISRALRRAIDTAPAPRPAAIVATSHDDLIAALQPDRILTCDFEEAAIHLPNADRFSTE